MAPRTFHYWVYVADEASDQVSRVRYGPDGAVVEKTIPVGIMPADLDGPHGLAVSPDGHWWYVTTAHGTPWGRLWKFRTGTDSLAGSVQLGLFPSTIGLTPDGGEALVANFDLHGDVVPSTVSAVATGPVLAEMGRIGACPRPHGVRVGPDGLRAWFTCVATDSLVEVSVPGSRVARSVRVTVPGGACQPTWAEPSADGAHVYVACNGDSTVVELETEGLTVTRRIAVGRHPYNLEATRDGRWLLATDKGGRAVSLVDLDRGVEAARMATSRPLPHGVVATPDSRFAFVSDEAVGATPGAVDVFDLEKKKRVASVEVGLQPGGIDFWRMQALARRPELERYRRPERGETGEGGEGGPGPPASHPPPSSSSAGPSPASSSIPRAASATRRWTSALPAGPRGSPHPYGTRRARGGFTASATSRRRTRHTVAIPLDSSSRATRPTVWLQVGQAGHRSAASTSSPCIASPMAGAVSRTSVRVSGT